MNDVIYYSILNSTIMKQLIYLSGVIFCCLLAAFQAHGQFPLEVECVGNNGIQLTQAGSPGLLKASVTTTGAVVGTTTNVPLVFIANNLPRITLNNNGKVGIGLSSPQRLLHVNEPGNTGGPKTEVLMLQSSNSKRPTLAFSEDGTSSMSIEYDGRLLGPNNKIHINNISDQPEFTFTSGGFMGIGQDSPLSPLHIVKEGTSNVPTTCLLLESNTSNRPRIGFSEADDGFLAMGLEYDGSGGASTNRMHITGESDDPIATFVRTSKYVGVGTINPQKPLHIEGGVNEGLRITREGQPVVLDAVANGNEAAIGTSSNHSLRLFTNNTIRMHIKNDGNVGIGTVGPLHKLHVNGTIAGSQVICGTTSLCSDVRFKKDILPFKSPMEQLTKLQGVNYYWDTDKFSDRGFGKEKQIGFVAQEIQSVFPELVYTDPEGYLSVDYTSLVPVLVEALKEQQMEFDTYEKHMNKRLKEIEDLLKKRIKHAN